MLLAVTPPVLKHRNALTNRVYSNVRNEINNLNLINVAWLRWLIVHYIYVLISTLKLIFQIVFQSHAFQQCVVRSCVMLQIFLLRFEVLTAVDIKTEIIWDITVCSLVPQCFWDTCYLHFVRAKLSVCCYEAGGLKRQGLGHGLAMASSPVANWTVGVSHDLL
jgi:hypothetical protein